MAKRKPTKHVGLIGGGKVFCFHCGGSAQLIPKEGIRVTSKAMRALTLLGEDFEDEHAKCVETDKSPTRRKFETPEEWIEGHDTGLSSCTIVRELARAGHPGVVARANEMLSGYPDGMTPRDASDFGRCYRLLTRHFPQWRDRLPEVAERHPDWAPLVAAWAELEGLFAEEKYQELSDRIRALTGP